MKVTSVLPTQPLRLFLLPVMISFGGGCGQDTTGVDDLEARQIAAGGAPATPVNLDVRPTSASALPISLRWDAVPGATSYQIFRGRRERGGRHAVCDGHDEQLHAT